MVVSVARGRGTRDRVGHERTPVTRASVRVAALGAHPAERPRRVLAHGRFVVRERGLEHPNVVDGTDAA